MLVTIYGTVFSSGHNEGMLITASSGKKGAEAFLARLMLSSSSLNDIIHLMLSRNLLFSLQGEFCQMKELHKIHVPLLK